ncbi:serine/threonine-protein kinase, partial [Phycicoccus avicenniae]
ALPPGPLRERDDDDAVQVSADPRIGLPTRSGVLLALLALLGGVTAAAPLVGLLLLAAWMVLARTSDRSVTSLVMRRHARGARGSDVAVAVAASPWHLVVGAVGSLVTLAVPLLVGVCAMFAGALVVGGVTGDATRADAVVPLLAAGGFTALTAWWGPGGAALRRGSRSLVRGLTGHDTVRQVLVAAFLLGGAALVALAVSRGAPSWWPLSTPPGWVDEVVPGL